MDERVALFHYSVNSNQKQNRRRRVTFRLASPSCTQDSTAVGDLDKSYQRDHWIFKMLCSKFCIVLLLVKVFLLGVILPVHLQNVDYSNQPEPPNYTTDDDVLHGYPNLNDNNHNNHDASHGNHGHENNQDGDLHEIGPNGDSTTEYVEGSQVPPPPPEEGHNENEVTELANSNGGTADSESSSDIIVVQHIVDEPVIDLCSKITQITSRSDVNDDGVSGNVNGEVETSETRQSHVETTSNSAGSCQSGSSIPTGQLTEKLDNLLAAIQNIDQSINKMEILMQSTVVDERIYKCIAAITTGNETLALKYWNQILRYQDTTAKKSNVLTQLIKESYSGKEDNIVPVVKFIEKTTHYYGYLILHKEMVNYGQIFGNRRIFTLASYIQKNCGRNSLLFKALPKAVQSVYSDYFTLQSKFNKGYLYYAKRCVARHYYYCLDVLTKRIAGEELDALEGEEKRRYHWKLNATDETASKYFILNQDKYWSYRLQDLHNSPRFKMEEAGSIFEIEWAHFQLMLHSENEIAIQVRDTNIYLEGEEFKFDNTTDVLLHSFHKTEHLTDSDKIYWLVKPVTGVDQNGNTHGNGNVEHENCVLQSDNTAENL